ncbi:MAG: TonB-dependent receptor [Acidobacteria bacterium]|nr:TonB-dependent receptor [Acidobacteriota bacterium]
MSLALTLMLFLGLSNTPLCAQTGTGSVQGTVKDITGSVIPNAKTRLRNTQTAVELDSTTNNTGFFLFPAVQKGSYELTVESTGMESWKGTLNLAVGQVAQIDPVLKVGSTGTTVTVAGDVTPLVTTTGPTLSNIVEHERIEQLPLNGRFIQSLVLMTTPGLENGSVPRLYGLRYAMEYVQDGALLENRDWASLPNRPPGIDSIGEFLVETSNSSAKMSRPGSIVLTTKAGTNMFHGALFETHRNSGFGVARARQDFFSKPPKLIRNEYGASAGGPVIIPKLYNGKNRTFVFGAYEALRLRSEATRAITMPTAAMRDGDFSGLIDGQGRRFTLYDPWSTAGQAQNWSRVPFTGNRLPSNRLSPLAKSLYAITPMPTHPDVNPLVAENWFGTGFSNRNDWTFTTRVDHTFSDKDRTFFRYSHNISTSPRTSSGIDAGTPTTLDGRGNGAIDEGQNDSGVASWTRMFSPSFFSELNVSFMRDYRGQIPLGGLGNIPGELGLPNPFNGGGFPRVQQAGFRMNYDTGINYTLNYANVLMVDENMTKVHGRHEFQFGGRWRYERLDTLVDQTEAAGNHNFSTNGTGLYDPTTGSAYGPTPFTGHNAANFHLGLANYNARFNRSWFRLRGGERALYFQDNWKVNSRLTINYGVRYEYNIPGFEANNTFIGYNKAAKAIVLGRSIQELQQLGISLPPIVAAYEAIGAKYQTLAESGLPKNFFYPNRLDFGPRAGFAYRMGGSARPTVIRGGYSIFAYPESLRLFNGTAAQNVPGQAIFNYDQTAAASSADGLPNYLMRSVPTVIAGQNSATVIDLNRAGGIARGSGVMYHFDPNQPTARAHEWNLLVERELFDNTSLRVGYVGTHGARMNQWYSYNNNPTDYVWFTRTGEPLPTGAFASVARRSFDQTTLGTMQEYRKTGWSNSQNFTFEVQRRYAKGIGFQVFYTLSNAMRVAGDGWRDDSMLEPNIFLPGAVPEDYNARNRLLNYRRDISVPKHRVNANWVVDVPIGKGKAIAGKSGRLADAIIGGWQVAGNMEYFSRYITIGTGNWGQLGNIEVYDRNYKVQDCRSGVCFDGWLFYNGYIPANRVNSTAANGLPNGVMGVPSNYKPSSLPIFPTPANGGSSADPNFAFYESNTIFVPLKNGTLQRTTLNTNLHPWRNQFLPAPWLFTLNGSLFKAVPITESVIARVNIDMFNALNNPGLALPDGGTGIMLNRFSANTPRNMQVTLRLTW